MRGALLRATDSGARAPALEGSSQLPRQPSEQGGTTMRGLSTSCQDKYKICREITRRAVLISLRDLGINYNINRMPPQKLLQSLQDKRGEPTGWTSHHQRVADQSQGSES